MSQFAILKEPLVVKYSIKHCHTSLQSLETLDVLRYLHFESMLYEAVITVSLPLCIVVSLICFVSAEDRLDCLLGRKQRYHYQHHVGRHPLDHDPILFDHDHNNNIDEMSSSDDIVHEWRSSLERLSSLPTMSMAMESSSSRIRMDCVPATTISPGPHHAHEVDIRKQKQQYPQHHSYTTNNLQLRARSTGTTIVALLANNSTVLILAADTRATDGTIVADKRCKKLHALANNVWCAGAGTSADVEALVRRVKFTFWKRGRVRMMNEDGVAGSGGGGGGVGNNSFSDHGHIIADRRHANTFIDDDDDYYHYKTEDNALPLAPVPTMLHHIRTQLGRAHGELGANLLVGGYDYNSHRALLAAVHPHGSMDVVNYSALGSGGLAAMGVLESKYPKMHYGGSSGSAGNDAGAGGRIRGITVEEGIQLAVDAVRAGIENDLGSGSQIDVCVIRREGTFFQRALVREQALTWTKRVHDDEIDGPQQLDDNETRMSNDELVDTKANQQFDTAGVNGFGNVPFAIRSKRIVCGGYPSDARREYGKFLERDNSADK